jgi:hypothetical protein
MTEHMRTPLIGPLRRRGWRAIARFRPLSNTPHTALVITRQGRLAGVIPAGERRVLSDYVTWPYDFREVDMRERRLLVRQRVASRDAGYEFDATLQLTYQVERPERVALELEDALIELEQALAQSMRVTSHSFGVEQAKALEENLSEALLYGDVLRERLAALGLALRRADVVVDLDDHARARAELLHNQMRERPLLSRITIESLDPQSSFDVLAGGSYRQTSRAPSTVAPEVLDAALQEAIARTLRRIAISYAPQDYLAAADAMAEALRHDSLLQAELSAAEIELIRPTVKIQPDRHMLVAARAAPLALPAPAPEPARGAPTDRAAPAAESADLPPWAAIGAAFGRETPPAPVSPAGEPQAQLTETPQWLDAFQQLPNTADKQALDQFVTEVIADDMTPEIASVQLPDEDAFEPVAPSDPHDTFAAPPDDPRIVDERIARWIALLEANDPALFKLWVMEISGQPESLPRILSALTSDPAGLASADDLRYQRALVLALAARGEPGAPAAADAH